MRLHNRQPVVRIRHDVRHLYAYGVCEGILACLAYITLPAIGWTSDFVLIAGYGMGGCSLCRISQGLRRKLGLRELTRARPLSRTVAWIDDLKTRLGQADRLYIGEGFTWGPEHTQAYHEVYELAEKRVLLPMDRQARDAGGLPYIHGICCRNTRRSSEPRALEKQGPLNCSSHSPSGRGILSLSWTPNPTGICWMRPTRSARKAGGSEALNIFPSRILKSVQP